MDGETDGQIFSMSFSLLDSTSEIVLKVAVRLGQPPTEIECPSVSYADLSLASAAAMLP